MSGGGSASLDPEDYTGTGEGEEAGEETPRGSIISIDAISEAPLVIAGIGLALIGSLCRVAYLVTGVNYTGEAAKTLGLSGPKRKPRKRKSSSKRKKTGKSRKGKTTKRRRTRKPRK